MTIINRLGSSSYLSGWSSTHDTEYTQGVPFVVGNGQKLSLTSNGLGILTIDSELPTDRATPYFNNVTNSIEPSVLGDDLFYRITMQVTPSTSNVIMDLTLEVLDTPAIVTGSSREIFANNDEVTIEISTSTFVLQNFIDNGAKIYIAASGGSLSIYDLKIKVSRVHKGKG